MVLPYRIMFVFFLIIMFDCVGMQTHIIKNSQIKNIALQKLTKINYSRKNTQKITIDKSKVFIDKIKTMDTLSRISLGLNIPIASLEILGACSTQNIALCVFAVPNVLAIASILYEQKVLDHKHILYEQKILDSLDTTQEERIRVKINHELIETFNFVTNGCFGTTMCTIGALDLNLVCFLYGSLCLMNAAAAKVLPSPLIL